MKTMRLALIHLSVRHKEPEKNRKELLAGVRTIEKLCVAACAQNRAGVWISPESHHRWGETLAEPGNVCRCSLDTNRTRFKNFQDDIDFQVLLSREA